MWTYFAPADPPPRQRISGQWQVDDFDVFDGDREVGRIYQVTAHDEKELRPRAVAL